MGAPYLLNPHSCEFPEIETACVEPNGLLAVGGDLSVDRLLSAYRLGIFPWYNEDQPILWWSPNPRAVLFPQNIKISRSLAKTLRNKKYQVTFDRCFGEVIQACAEPRPDQDGTWIIPEMTDAYRLLHEMGIAHSIETWYEGNLVGGLYGVSVGRIFFGESMFSRQRDASKVALARLCEQLDRWGFPLIDCQLESDHLLSLGAELIPRETFREYLDEYCAIDGPKGNWDKIVERNQT